MYDIKIILLGPRSNITTWKEGIKTMLTVETLEKELDNLLKEGDIEKSHIRADCLLCVFLEQLGYKSVVDKFARLEKWYS